MRVIKSLAACVGVLFVGAGTAHATAANYPALQSTIKYSKTSTAASAFGNFASATSTVVYDPVAGTYTVRDTGSLTTKSSFGPSNISSSNANFTTYSKPGTGTTETLRVLNASAPLIALSYVHYGQWRRTSTASGTTSVNDTYLVFGTKSPSSAVSTGSGSYSTIVDGTFVDKTGSYAVSGTGTFTANFGATGGTLAYSTTANATPETSGTAFSFGTMNGTGSIATRSASFRGTGSTNGSGYAMDVAGSFYGPAAQEIGGTFRIRGNNGNGIGVIVGN